MRSPTMHSSLACGTTALHPFTRCSRVRRLRQAQPVQPAGSPLHHQLMPHSLPQTGPADCLPWPSVRPRSISTSFKRRWTGTILRLPSAMRMPGPSPAATSRPTTIVTFFSCGRPTLKDWRLTYRRRLCQCRLRRCQCMQPVQPIGSSLQHQRVPSPPPSMPSPTMPMSSGRPSCPPEVRPAPPSHSAESRTRTTWHTGLPLQHRLVPSPPLSMPSPTMPVLSGRPSCPPVMRPVPPSQPPHWPRRLYCNRRCSSCSHGCSRYCCGSSVTYNLP
jgi:hypothetical protein